METKRKEKENKATKNHSLSPTSQRPSGENEQENKNILEKIHQSSPDRLARISPDVEIHPKYQETREADIYILPDCLRRDIRSHSNQKDERNPKPEKKTEEHMKKNHRISRIRI